MSERSGDIGIGAGGHQPSVLLTLGRLPVALELARAFAGAGWRVVVLDSMSWHLCRVSKAIHQCIKVPSPKTNYSAYSNEVLAIIKRENIELVVPVSEESAYITAIAEQFPSSTLCISVDHAMWLLLHDKQRCMEFLHAQNLPVPQTVSLPDALARSTQALEDCVVKKRFTAAGVGLQYLDAHQRYPEVENPHDWIVQTKLLGAEVCAFAVFKAGKLQCVSCYEASLLDGSVSVGFTQHALPEGIHLWLEQFGHKTDYNGLASFDFMKNSSNQWCALECNPRATSGIHFIPPVQLIESIVEQNKTIREQEPAKPPAQHTSKMRTHKMEFWSSFTLCFSRNGRKQNGFKHLYNTIGSSQDITWSKTDPWPFILMPLVSSALMWRAFIKSERLAESAVADITWPPEE